MNWVKKLTEIIENENVKGKEIAEILGVTPGYISSVLNLRKEPSQQLKASIAAHAGLEFDRDLLMEMLDFKTKEFIINYEKSNTIKYLKEANDKKDWGKMIEGLCLHRNWSIEDLGRDLNLETDKLIKFMDGKGNISELKKLQIRDRIQFEIINSKIFKVVPEKVGNILKEANQKNMIRIAEKNKKKAERNGDK